MSQPQTITETALEEFRQAGVVRTRPRLLLSKKLTGFNAEVYSGWIERWANNAATNSPVVKGSQGVGFLKNAAKGVPAVVVGIGPSLDESINDLKKAPRHSVVIATDAALRPLVRHGIHPDIVLNFDARDHQPTMWESIDTSPYILLANSCTSPLTIDAWRGSVMFFNMMQNDDEFCSNILPSMFPYIAGLPNMGTVGNGAIYLAHYMGCKPVLGVGMDLCYQLDLKRPSDAKLGSTAAILGGCFKYRCKDWHFVPPTAEMPDGAWEEIENKTLYDNADRLEHTLDEEIKGKTYKVDPQLQAYRRSLISNVGQYDIPFINCSGGVLTDLVKSMSLRDALEQKCYPALEPGRTIVKHLPKLIPAANKDWRLVPDARLFIPTDANMFGAANPKR